MERFGTTSEQLGAVAVAQRQWAAGNPLGAAPGPDHAGRSSGVALGRRAAAPARLLPGLQRRDRRQSSPPLRRPRPGRSRRCTSGAGARAILGTRWLPGARSGCRPEQVRPGGRRCTWPELLPADVTMCQLYDCYTYTVLVTLEDYGFCAKGEGGPFAASGALGPGGTLPVNTGGGQLSGYYMWGFTPLSEAVIQARGEGGAPAVSGQRRDPGQRQRRDPGPPRHAHREPASARGGGGGRRGWGGPKGRPARASDSEPVRDSERLGGGAPGRRRGRGRAGLAGPAVSG